MSYKSSYLNTDITILDNEKISPDFCIPEKRVKYDFDQVLESRISKIMSSTNPIAELIDLEDLQVNGKLYAYNMR